MRWPRRRVQWLLALATTLLCCVASEAALRAHAWLRTPMCVPVDDSRMYALNPKFPEVSSLGLRNCGVVIPKPKGRYRVLVLGDSVAFGVGVRRSDAFPQQLNRILGERAGDIEVVNCGIPGYSTYNELEFYRTVGHTLEADLVLLEFCMNDIINPRLGWATAGYSAELIDRIPTGAIPDRVDDAENVRPMLARERQAEADQPFVTRSALLTLVFDTFFESFSKPREVQIPKVPTYVAFEDPTSIQVLLNDRSPQSEWLIAQLGRLNNATAADGAELVVLIFPLAYQMDPGYPYAPQDHLASACKAHAISSLDILPILAPHRKSEMFRLATGEYYDVWHLTSAGNGVVASALAQVVQDHRASRKALPSRARP